MFSVVDENLSWYLDENIASFCTDPGSVDKEDEEFQESNKMHGQCHLCEATDFVQILWVCQCSSILKCASAIVYQAAGRGKKGSRKLWDHVLSKQCHRDSAATPGENMLFWSNLWLEWAFLSCLEILNVLHVRKWLLKLSSPEEEYEFWVGLSFKPVCIVSCRHKLWRHFFWSLIFDLFVFPAINGFVFGNLPMLTMCAGDHISWHLFGMGNEIDVHTAYFHGETLNIRGHRTDVASLFPATFVAADMIPSNPGRWLLSCQLNDHIEGKTDTGTCSAQWPPFFLPVWSCDALCGRGQCLGQHSH